MVVLLPGPCGVCGYYELREGCRVHGFRGLGFRAGVKGSGFRVRGLGFKCLGFKGKGCYGKDGKKGGGVIMVHGPHLTYSISLN